VEHTEESLAKELRVTEEKEIVKPEFPWHVSRWKRWRRYWKWGRKRFGRIV
jgi:hypothetical protein